MAKTLQERYIAALTAKGFKEVKRTLKFIVLNDGGGHNYYIGRHGSLRHGATSTNSLPCSDKFKHSLLMEAEVTPVQQ